MSLTVEKKVVDEVKVPKDKYWDVITQKNIENFSIGTEKVPMEIIIGFAYLKKSCAIVNNKQNKLSKEKAAAILQACDEIINRELNDNFPLVVWQSGSGIQSNINVNEVIALRATQILGIDLNDTEAVCASEDVNKSQNSNDSYPTAMRIAFVLELERRLIPSIKVLKKTFKKKSKELDSVIKLGKLNHDEAKPLTIGQEIGVYVQMLNKAKKQIKQSLKYLQELSVCGSST